MLLIGDLRINFEKFKKRKKNKTKQKKLGSVPKLLIFQLMHRSNVPELTG